MNCLLATGNKITTDGTWDYTHDNEGNITEKNKAGADNEKWTYGYDHKNLMEVAKHYNDNGDLLVKVEFISNALGNCDMKAVVRQWHFDAGLGDPFPL